MASQRILVVDDDEQYLALLGHGLLRAGFHCWTASGSAAAWKILARDIPDLVVLDQRLQGESGESICERIRAMPAMSRVPVAFLTGDKAFADGAEWLESGGDTCWLKPTSASRLAALVRGLLRRHAWDMQARELLGPGLWLDRPRRAVIFNGRRSKKLTDRELHFMETLGAPAGVLLSRQAAIQAVFAGGAPESPELAFNEMLRKFRAKLPRALAKAIETVYGRGFRLNLPGPDGEPTVAAAPPSPTPDGMIAESVSRRPIRP